MQITLFASIVNHETSVRASWDAGSAPEIYPGSACTVPPDTSVSLFTVLQHDDVGALSHSRLSFWQLWLENLVQTSMCIHFCLFSLCSLLDRRNTARWKTPLDMEGLENQEHTSPGNMRGILFFCAELNLISSVSASKSMFPRWSWTSADISGYKTCQHVFTPNSSKYCSVVSGLKLQKAMFYLPL